MKVDLPSGSFIEIVHSTFSLFLKWLGEKVQLIMYF